LEKGDFSAEVAVQSDMTTSTKTPFLQYDRTLGVASMEGRGFYYPVDVAIAGDGKIYGLSRSHEGDPRGVRVCILDLDSGFHGVFGSVGESDGQFTWATAVAQDVDGRVYVSDEYTQRISIFDSSGNFRAKWGTHGSVVGEIDGPSGLAFTAENDLLVADSRNHRVQKFTTDGLVLMSFGSQGSGEGQFNLPWGVAVREGGEIYVADWRNDRIQRFSPDGEFVAGYGSSGDGDGEFNRPSGVAVDAEGYVYVADWGNERVQVLDPDGGFVMKLRGEATVSPWAKEFLDANRDEADARSRSDLESSINIRGKSEHATSSHIEKLFWAPVSVKLDGEGRLYVVDRNRHRIQVYRRT
jgi:DNA-binding beta-propeller fold protein YncE